MHTCLLCVLPVLRLLPASASLPACSAGHCQPCSVASLSAKLLLHCQINVAGAVVGPFIFLD